MRSSDRKDSVKQNENSILQEHVTEASLISFAVSSRERREKPRCLFSFARPVAGLTPPGQGVGRATSCGGVEGFKSGEDLKSCPFLSPSADYPTSFGRCGRKPVLVHASEGGCLDSFLFVHVDATARESRFTSTNEFDSLAVASKLRKKE